MALELIDEAFESGARKSKACYEIGVTLRTYQRLKTECLADKRKGALKNVPRKLSEAERQMVIDIACDKKYKDLTPYEIVAILAENGDYIASERTFYRILKDFNLLHHRGNNKPKSKTGKPAELKATGPRFVSTKLSLVHAIFKLFNLSFVSLLGFKNISSVEFQTLCFLPQRSG